MTRAYEFTVGPETSDQPGAGTPSGDDDLVTRGYADGRYTQGSISVADIATLKALGTADRADGDLVCVQATNVLYIFDAGSSATGDDTLVLTPDAGTGRWLRATTTAGEGAADSGTGEINYIDNGTAEFNTSGWALYVDAAGSTPVDGTGDAGSANITWTRQASTILRGSQSFKLTKDAADRQGEGVSYDFTIKEQDVSKKLKIQFDFKTDEDAAYAAGDLAVYIYDVTNSTLITPVDTDIISGQNIFQTSFNSTTSTSYRLIFHVTSTNASAWDAYIDNVIVGPGMTSQGAAIGKWESFTVVSSWSTNTTHTAFKRRVGDTLEMMGTVELSGAPDTATLTIDLPDSLNIDANLIPGTGSKNHLGTGTARDATGATGMISVNYDGANTDSVRLVSYRDSSATALVTQAAPWTWANGDDIRWEAKIPIAEWAGKGIVPMLAEDNLSEWQAISDTSVTNLTTNIEAEGGYYKRVGDDLLVRGHLEFSGANTESGAIAAVVPESKTIDTNKISVSGIGGSGEDRYIIGQWHIRDNNAADTYSGSMAYDASEDLIYFMASNGTQNLLDASNNIPITFADGDIISWEYRVPVTEFAGSQNSLVGYSEASADNLGLVKKPDGNIKLTTGNGYGSSSTKIRRFSVEEIATGTSMSYADSATLGASITINEDGLYSITYFDITTATAQIGASLNSAAVTTNIASIAASERILYSETETGSGESASIVTPLSAGDVIRPHTSGAAASTSGAIFFQITQIAKL